LNVNNGVRNTNLLDSKSSTNTFNKDLILKMIRNNDSDRSGLISCE
jgi:hypothetical protein